MKTRTVRAAITRHPLLAAMLVATALTVAFGMSRSANATTATCSNPATLAGSAFEIDVNANLIVNTNGCIDWLADGTGSALRTGVLSKQDTASGTDDDAFGQGTKENDANPTIVNGSIPPNKSDLKFFGVFTETSGTAKFLELFWTRINSPQGTTNMDFELNQKFCNPTATPTNCANNGVPTPKTPLRTIGDKLITYDLSQGGTVPTISIRTWDGSVWGPATVISGPGGSARGSVNSTTIAAADAGGVGGSTTTNPPGGLDPFTFGEAAINFAALFPPGGECGRFGSAYLKSRSSDAFNSEIKDFIAPERVNITNCTLLTTQASGPVTIGSSISDTATLSGGVSPTGSITFRAFSDASCSAQVFTSTVPVNGNGDYNSGNFTPTAVGTYYWTASYSGDGNNASSATACGEATESSVVNKAQPGIVTHASGPVTIGNPISDTATLSGGFSPTGSITFRAFSDASCSTQVFTSTVPVSGNGDYGSGDFTPTAAGTYFWTASYSGDANNLAASTACGDANESSVVNKAQPGIVTQASGPVTIGSAIHDTATLSGGFSPTGSITFRAFSDASCSTQVFTSTVPVSGNGDYGSGDFTPTAAGTYFWTASYSGDANNLAASTACGDANESSVVNKAESSIATVQRLFPQDSATISALAGGTPTGSVTFSLYGPDDLLCSGLAVFSQTVALSGGSAETSNTLFSVIAGTSGTYRWVVSYPGDDTHLASTSACGTEQFTATITNG
jgi:hypothetical protein